MVVDVDNAVRTSDNELALAVEEFGDKDTAPFSLRGHQRENRAGAGIQRPPDPRRRGPRDAGAAPRPADPGDRRGREGRPRTRRPTGGVRAAAGSGDQRADPAGRDDPADGRSDRAHRTVGAGAGRAAQPIRRLGTGFGGRQCRNRQAAADLRRPEHHQRAATWCRDRWDARPGWSTPSARRSRRWARRGRCSTPSTARRPTSTARSPPCRRPSPTSRTASRPPGDQLAQGNTAHADELSAARDAAVKAVADAQSTGTADPLGAFTKLTQADAELDRLLASVAEEREAAERLSRAFDQALFAAQSRVRAVSDFIDVRRGSIGPEARTRLAEAVRQLQAAQDKRATNLTEAIAHANGAAMLASQAQSMANCRCPSSATGVRRAVRQHEQLQHGRGARRHHPRQHPQRRRCAAGSAAAWAAAGARRHTAGPARWSGVRRRRGRFYERASSAGEASSAWQARLPLSRTAR